ncbi:MAG TPA: hypothetical protein VG413_07280 [Candidatus Dormibacteraeota bacterium]|jgi:hypothetical protein|nr:hypothetical protein [Candidatus Dormibacteraeota bacterium]
MGVGGISADEMALAQRLVAEMDELARRYEGQGLGETVDREVYLIRHGCARLELVMWRTSTLFCKTQ